MNKYIILLLIVCASVSPFIFATSPDSEALPITIPPINNGNISELSIFLGLSPGFSVVDKFGKNLDVDTSYEEIWNDGGVLTLLSSPSTLTITSTLADTSGDTGARTLTIQGLNGTYNIIEETITLNSTTPPTSSNSYLRVLRAFVVESGSSLTNENDIIITATTGGSTQAHILANEGQTQKTQYTIPAGYTGYLISGYFATDSGQHMNGQLMVKPFGGSWLVKHETILTDGVDRFDLEGTAPIPEKSDLTWRAKGSLSNNEVTAGYHLVLKEN